MSGLPSQVIRHAAQKARQFERAMAEFQGEELPLSDPSNRSDDDDEDAWLAMVDEKLANKMSRVGVILKALAQWQNEPNVRNRQLHYVSLLTEWSQCEQQLSSS